MESVKQRIAELLISYPKSLLISLALLSFIAIYPASQIKTNFNLEEFFPKEDPTLITYQKTAELFGRDDNTLIIAFEPQLLDNAFLFALKDVEDSISKHPYVNKVQSVWDLSSISNLDDSFYSEPFLSNENPFAGITLIQSDPNFSNTFISDNSKITILLVSIKQSNNVYTYRKQLINDINQIILSTKLNHSYFISGIPHFRTQYVDYLNKEIVQYIGLGSILILSLLWLLYRNIRDVLLPILIVWLTILFTVAVMSLSGGFFEIMSSTVAPILLCVGIGDSVHMLSKYNDSILLGIDRRTSLLETIRTLGLATLLTSITTAIGFATLLVSNVMPMKRFGLYTAIGVMIAFVSTILFLPSFIWQFKRKHALHYEKAFFDQLADRFLLRIRMQVENHYKLIVISGVFIGLILGSGAFHLKINSKVFDDIGHDSDLIKNVTKISESLLPPVQMDIILDSGFPEGVFNPEIFKVIAEIESDLTSIPEIKKVRSMNAILQKIHSEFTNSTDPFYEQSNEVTSNYLFLLELNSSDVFSNFIDFEYRHIRISTFMDDIGSDKVNLIRQKMTKLFNEKYPEYNLSLSGTGILVTDLAQNLVYSLNSSIILALIFIGLIMFLMFKEIQLTLISILPNLFPLLITAGIMGYLDIPLKPSTAVIFTITFGIAVDDTIHFLARYRIERKKLKNEYTSIFTTLERTGKAIILTSLILLAGFGVLITSEFDSTKLMGLLTSFTILTAVIYDLFFLPALLFWRFKSQNHNR